MVPHDASSVRRPNVVLIMADQLQASALGYAGNRIVRTPNLDRLAARGTVFENAFVQSPVCMASRAAIHTGRYPRATRVRSMILLPPDETTLAETLQRSGYATGTFGKLHLTPMGYQLQQLHDDHENDDAQPFMAASGLVTPGMIAAAADPFKRNYGFQTAAGVGDSTWGHYLDWLSEVAPEHVPHHVSENWGLGRNGLTFGDSPPATRMFHPRVRDFFDSHMPAEVHPSAFIASKTLEFVRANQHRPFFVHASFVDPHHPFNAARPYNRMYHGSEMPVPDAFDPERCFPDGLAEAVVRKIAHTADAPPDLWQWALANYYGMVSHVDACVGQILDGIEAMGLAEDTIVIFMADHGEYAGDHNLLYKGALHFDCIMRVPLIVSWGTSLAPRRVRSLVQEIDVFPTVLDMLGLAIPPGVQGKSLATTVCAPPGDQQAASATHYDYVTCELDQLLDATYVPSQTLRTPEWKLEVFPREHTGMLFNLKDDPGERQNLYRDPGYSHVRHELTLELLNHLYEAKDPLPLRISGA